MAEERQYSHGRHVASDALRGLAVGIPGCAGSEADGA